MSTHEDHQPRFVPKSSSDRAFGFVWAAVFAIVGCLPLRHGRPVRIWAVGLAAALLLIALARPSLLKDANRLWTQLGLLLGRVVNPIVMAVLFYLVVTPIGLVMRGFSKDPLRLKWQPDAPTYWIPREPAGPDPKTMANQF